MISWDERASTDAERYALSELRRVTGGSGGVMEHHALRIALLCDRLAAKRGVKVDAEVVNVAALLHDIGLYDGPSRGGVYTRDGALFARELLDGFGWSAARVDLCAEAIDRHHELRSQAKRGEEVEIVRLADRVDVGGGLVRAGLSREEVRTVMAAVPRAGLYRHIGGLVGGALRTRPLSLPKIFVR